MVDPISPISTPHGYYSQIPNSDQVTLTPQLETLLKVVTGRLEQMSKEAGYPYPRAAALATDLQETDSALTAFFVELNKNPNRGYDSIVREVVTNLHSQFTKDLDPIKNAEGTSLRDVLDDPEKCEKFLTDLSTTAEGRKKLHLIAPLAKTFSQQLMQAFALQKS